MATICPQCWGRGERTEMALVSNGQIEEYTPVDRLPDGTEIRHSKRLTTSVYGMCSCPKCGHREEERSPRVDHDTTKAGYLNGNNFKVRIQISPGEFFERTTWSDRGSPEQAAADTILRVQQLGVKTGYDLQVESVEPASKK